MGITVGGTAITFNDATTQSTAATSSIPTGTVMLFVQTAAPTGWTKSTAHDNKALRVVSGTASSGGSAAFTTAFGTPSVTGSVTVSGTTGATTLSTAQMPSHTHVQTVRQTGGSCYTSPNTQTASTREDQSIVSSAQSTQATGGGGSHTHSFSGSGSLSGGAAAINVAYVDVIFATKN
jgi:hypothetical protein